MGKEIFSGTLSGTENPYTHYNTGTKDTLQVVWEMRVRELEEAGWTTA